MRGSKQQYANKNLNAMASRPNSQVASTSSKTTTALRGNLMVLQGTAKVSKPVGAAAIPVPPVTTPSLKKEKSIGGSSMVWKEATGTNKSVANVDSNVKLDVSKTDNPWTEITVASDGRHATRDIHATKNDTWTEEDKNYYNRRDNRDSNEYSDNYPLYKEQSQMRDGRDPYDRRTNPTDHPDPFRSRSYSHNEGDLHTREYNDTSDNKWERNQQHIDNSPPRQEVIHVSKIQSRDKPVSSVADNTPAVLKAVRQSNSKKNETLGKMEVITSAFNKVNVGESATASAGVVAIDQRDSDENKVETKLSYAALFPKAVSAVKEDKPMNGQYMEEERNGERGYRVHEGDREGGYGRRYDGDREGDYGRRYDGGRDGEYGRRYDDGHIDEGGEYGDYPRRYNDSYFNYNQNKQDMPEDEEIIDIDPDTVVSRSVSTNKPRMLFDPSSNKLVDFNTQKGKGKKVPSKGKKDPKDAVKAPVAEKKPEKVVVTESTEEVVTELAQEELIARRLAREKNKSKRLPRTKGFLFTYDRDGELVEVD